MKIYTTVREDGNVGPDIIAKNFNEVEKDLELIKDRNKSDIVIINVVHTFGLNKKRFKT